MSDFTTLAIAQEQGILQITLSRPDKLNALNATLLDELNTVLQHAAQDSDCRAILLTGAGKAFCAGAAIDELAALNAISGVAFAKRGQAVFDLLENLGKPSIAAVNGVALGGGCELAMATTLRIAASTAAFGQPEIKLGVIPGFGGTQRLPRLIGKGRAMELCLTGRKLDAATALQWGLVNAVVEPEELLQQAQHMLQFLLQQAPLALTATMQAIHHGADITLADGLAYEAAQFGLLCATQDKQEGVSAFLEKRTAVFQNN